MYVFLVEKSRRSIDLLDFIACVSGMGRLAALACSEEMALAFAEPLYIYIMVQRSMQRTFYALNVRATSVLCTERVHDFKETRLVSARKVRI